MTSPDGIAESYGYDGDNERVKKVRSGTTTIYLEGLWEETLGGATKVYYSFNGQPIAVRDTAGSLIYLHGDHLGSVSLATTTSGTVASQQEFDPWGVVRLGAVGQTSLNFTGQRLDATGLLYYHARYYDPKLGRFVSADSVVPDPFDPQDFNRYSYAKNNPLRYTDPTGHCIFGIDTIICVAAAGALLVGATSYVAIDSATRYAREHPTNWCDYTRCLPSSTNDSSSKQVPASSDTGGQTADPGGLNPDPNKRGPDQEQAVRDMLARQYHQKYGETDGAIRNNLGIGGKVADFVGHNSSTGRWLIAESKGGDMTQAMKQLQNTMNGLLGKESTAYGNVDLRIYTNAAQYQKFFQEPNGLAGYRLRDGFLGWMDEETQSWQYAQVNGVRISVQSVP